MELPPRRLSVTASATSGGVVKASLEGGLDHEYVPADGVAEALVIEYQFTYFFR
jgi:hypothetical protein